MPSPPLRRNLCFLGHRPQVRAALSASTPVLAPTNVMPPAKMTMEQKLAEAKRKAEEMNAKVAAKKAAKEAAGTAPLPPAVAADEKFLLGDHTLILIDWDDTLFPTSAWKDRIKDGAAHPPRASKIKALSEAISNFIGKLQESGTVKIVTHGTKSWYETSSRVLLPETKKLLDGLDHRYRDSHGDKYMRKKPSGCKYTTDIGVEVDNYGEWFKTDMFFHFISEKKTARKWDETHLPEKVILPRQVLIIGDGNAEKRSYDEHGNQARIYSTRPGHEAVANVGLKGVFFKDGPSYEELVLQQQWSTAQVISTFLPADDHRTMMWDLTGFPRWTCSLKAGANAYQPLSHGSLLDGLPQGAAGTLRGVGTAPTEDDDAMDAQLQMALAMSIATAAQAGGSDGASGPGDAAASNAAHVSSDDIEMAAAEQKTAEEEEEERAMQEAIALSLS